MSYSSELKNTLKEISMKKKCCRKAFYYGETLFSDDGKRNYPIDWSKFGYGENEEITSIKFENFHCQSCKSSFLRGVFCCAGTVSDPAKSFHFEIKTKNEALCNALYEFILNNCVKMKRLRRNEHYCLYLKKGDDIEDIIHYMGAGKVAFEVANEKIKRDFANLANRRNNIEVGNIKKTVDASAQSVSAIKKIIKNGKRSSLTKGLEETAMLRIENPYANLEELAEMHSEKITKSGVNHRLKRLIEISRED